MKTYKTAEANARATVEVFYRMMEDPDPSFTSLPDRVLELPTRTYVATSTTPHTRMDASEDASQNGLGCFVGLIVLILLTMLFSGCVSMVVH